MVVHYRKKMAASMKVNRTTSGTLLKHATKVS